MTFKEYKKLIDKNGRQIQSEDPICKRAEEHNELYRAYVQAKKSGDTEKEQLISAEMKKAREADNAIINHNKKIRTELKVMNNNLLRLLYNEMLPPTLTYLKTISGKPYGEKTADKLYKFFRENYNCAVFVSKDEIRIQPLSEQGYTTYINLRVCSNYGCDILTPDNKVNIDALNLDNFHTFDCKEFITDIPNYIRDMRRRFEKAKALIDKYILIRDEYSRLAVSDLQQLPYISSL